MTTKRSDHGNHAASRDGLVKKCPGCIAWRSGAAWMRDFRNRVTPWPDVTLAEMTTAD